MLWYFRNFTCFLEVKFFRLLLFDSGISLIINLVIDQEIN